MKRLAKKRYLIIVVIVLVIGVAVFGLQHRAGEGRGSGERGGPKTNISWPVAVKLINSCQVTSMTYGGGLQANGKVAPDEGYIYFTTQDGRNYTVRAGNNQDIANNDCDIETSVP